MKFNLKDLTEDFISSIAVRLEREYLYYEVFEDGRKPECIGSTCFVTPPAKGEYYLFHKKNEIVETYEVINTAHSHSADRAGYLYLKKVANVEIQ